MVTRKRSLMASVKNWILYYNIHMHFIFAVLVYMSMDLAAEWTGGLIDITQSSRYYKLFITIVNISLISMWIMSFFSDVRNKIYKRKTGRSYPKDKNRYRRSFHDLLEFYCRNEPQKMDVSKLPEIPWYRCNGLIFGKIGKKLLAYRPKKDGIVMLCWGRPGIGKTSAIIIPSARQFGLVWTKSKYIQKASVMVLDLKGDIYEANRKFRRIKRFSTIDWQNSCHYDPLAPIRNKSDEERAEYLDNLAVTVLPMINGGAEGSYFTKVARAFFTAIFLFTLHLDNMVHFGDVCIEITTKTYAEWGREIEESGYVAAEKYTNRFADENPRNVGGGYSQLCEAVLLYTKEHMKVLFTDNGNCISPKDLRNGTDIYIQIDPVKMELYAPLVAMLYQGFMSSALSDAIKFEEENKDNDKKDTFPAICYIIDEFGQIPRMPSIYQLAQLGRGYNLSLLLSTQSMASIDQNYGENGRKILMDCAKGHIFLSVMDPDTREWASKLIGEREILKTGSTENTNPDAKKSVGKSANVYTERIVKPEQFGLLQDNDSLILYYDGHYTIGEKTYYFKD